MVVAQPITVAGFSQEVMDRYIREQLAMIGEAQPPDIHPFPERVLLEGAQIMTVEDLVDIKWIECKDCEGKGSKFTFRHSTTESPCRTCGHTGKVPDPETVSFPTEDMLGRSVKVGDQVVASPRNRDSSRPRVCEVIRIRYKATYNWAEGKAEHDLTKWAVMFKLSGLPSERVKNDIVKIQDFHCDKCDEEKHRHDVLVLCGPCGKEIR